MVRRRVFLPILILLSVSAKAGAEDFDGFVPDADRALTIPFFSEYPSFFTITGSDRLHPDS